MHEHNPVSTGYRCKEVSEGLLADSCLAGNGKSGADQPLQGFMIDFGSSTFCNAGVLEFTAGSAELCRDREPGIAAVAGGSFWSQSSNIAEKKIKELLLGVRYQQELLFLLYSIMATGIPPMIR
ncbi:hypothetical protein M5E86_06520 [Blautia wexlerae]|nr:hypothetical protein M5E86_06520 [Blautia wexlerae]